MTDVWGLDHVQVSCPAGAEDVLRRFYGEVLGLAEIPKPAGLAARGGLWFQVGGQQLHCGVETEFQPARKAHPAFAATQAEALAVRLVAAGAPVVWDDAIPGVRRFHTADPVGNRLEVIEASDPGRV